VNNHQNGIEKLNLNRPLFSNMTRAIVWGMQTKVNYFQKKNFHNHNKLLFILGCSRYA
jgi:hypothetical protein